MFLQPFQSTAKERPSHSTSVVSSFFVSSNPSSTQCLPVRPEGGWGVEKAREEAQANRNLGTVKQQLVYPIETVSNIDRGYSSGSSNDSPDRGIGGRKLDGIPGSSRASPFPNPRVSPLPGEGISPFGPTPPRTPPYRRGRKSLVPIPEYGPSSVELLPDSLGELYQQLDTATNPVDVDLFLSPTWAIVSPDPSSYNDNRTSVNIPSADPQPQPQTLFSSGAYQSTISSPFPQSSNEYNFTDSSPTHSQFLTPVPSLRRARADGGRTLHRHSRSENRILFLPPAPGDFIHRTAADNSSIVVQQPLYPPESPPGIRDYHRRRRSSNF